MREIISRILCTGCGCCCNVCPKNAISVKSDNDGFRYPVIDKEKCIDCGLCRKKCPVLSKTKTKAINECYAAYNKNDDVLMLSSSGGIFYLLALSVLKENGIVIGAMFDSKKLVHMMVDNKKDLIKLMGSKYLQSNMDNIYMQVKKEILNRKVLFVGTPCQVAGLKSYIGKDNENLICIDLICHGVPSSKLFTKYIDELEEKNNDTLKKYNFRDKSTGWESYSNSVDFENISKTELAKDNYYMKLYLSDFALRESCYNCQFKLGNKFSDITLGDYWGVRNFHKEIYSKKGVSAVIINTKKGREIFNTIKKDIRCLETSLDNIVYENPCLKRSCNKPSKREKFLIDINNYNCKELCKKYCKRPLFKKIIMKIMSIIKL